MATGVKPRDEEMSFTRSDLEAIQDAMKSKKFRDLFAAYCEEVRDPVNQALYQKEMTQLEKERGYDITFINPKGGYVIKTSVAGDRKAFINICSNENVGKPSYSVTEENGQKGMSWQIPYSLIPPREDFDQKRQRCIIYDVVFHPDTLRMAEVNQRFRDLVNKTAFDALQKSYGINLDTNNVRYPKSHYKGLTTPAVIRKEDPNYKPSLGEETSDLSPEVLSKLYPQHVYPEKMLESKPEPSSIEQQEKIEERHKKEFHHANDNGYTVPKYSLKQQKNVDLQEFTLHKDSRQYSAIPSQLIIEINLPLLSSTKECILDVKEKSLTLLSEKPAKYKLNISLPYSVNHECGNAKFDKTKHLLIVSLPVIKKNLVSDNKNSLKIDSGVESEENSSSCEDECVKGNLVKELSSTSCESTLVQSKDKPMVEKEVFFDFSLAYLLPSYTHNILDNTIAFTFHVKNTEPDSVKVKKDGDKVYIKFTSVGSGFVPIHYAAVIAFDDDVKFDDVNGEAWDNNVILQLEMSNEVPQKFLIGLRDNNLVCEYFDVPHVKQSGSMEADEKTTHSQQTQEEIPAAIVEVTNCGSQTNIVVSSKLTENDEDDFESPVSLKEEEIMWKDSNCENGAKSILRKPVSMMRSFSESSVGDVASSMDYISSDCIPEESSFKKTVRFNDVIARQFYRYNSSIEGQKKKNQRKKNKKRNQEMRKSESEAEDENVNVPKMSKPRSVLKQRRDSGLADTSDAETECRNNTLMKLKCREEGDNEKDDNNTINEIARHTSILKIVDNNGNFNEESEPVIWESHNKLSNDTSESTNLQDTKKTAPITCDNIKHNTDLYNPDNLNKGQYLEVSFKNDLIFDLDM